MTRIASLPVEKWDKDLREMLNPEAQHPVEQTILGVYANAPDLAKAFFAFSGAMNAAFTIRPRMRELMRLRIAFHNQCRSCMAMRYEGALEDGLTEDTVCSLEKPMEAPDMTDAEKAAVQFADHFATNHLAISDDTIANLRKHFSEKEIVEICMYSAYCVGYGRFAATYKAVEDLPESFQDMSKRTAPWATNHSEKVLVPH
jgi:AhpD family alkylhydroperoxidase